MWLLGCLLAVARVWQSAAASAGPWVSHLALDHCLDDRYLNFHTFLGWMVTAANVANALVAAVCLVFVVRRDSVAVPTAACVCGQGSAHVTAQAWNERNARSTCCRG